MLGSKSFDKVIILIIITVFFYIGILIYSDINTVIDKVYQIRFEFLPLILSLMGIQIILLGIKFHRLLQKLEIKISIKESIKIYVAGLSLIATPAGIGTVIKSYILKKKFGHPISLTLSIIFIERLTELLAILIILTSFLLWVNTLESIIAIGLGFLLVIIMLMISSNNKIFQSLKFTILKINRIKKFSSVLDESKDSLTKLMQKKTFSEALGWSIMAKIVQFVAVYFIFLSVGIDLGLILSGQLYYTALVVGALTFIPSGIIITESTMLVLLINHGVELSIGTVAVLFTRIITTWLATILGVISLKSTGISSSEFKTENSL